MGVVNVFHEIEYGATTSSVPKLDPLSKNCTPATPTLSVAVAFTFIVPVTFPAAGAVILTTGGLVSLFTVTITPADVAVLPAASRAMAVNV